MGRNQKIITWIFIVLIAIGVLSKIFSSLPLIIMLVVFGVVFLLYKFPPDRWGRWRNWRMKPPGKRKFKSRKAKFRVINGNKKNGDDEPPRYH